MSDKVKAVDFMYSIRFEKTANKYRLSHYNQWHSNDEKVFDDIRVMFDGKDLKGNDLPAYKVISWEDLDDGLYDVSIWMILFETKNNAVEQLFTLKSLTSKSTPDQTNKL